MTNCDVGSMQNQFGDELFLADHNCYRWYTFNAVRTACCYWTCIGVAAKPACPLALRLEAMSPRDIAEPVRKR